MRILKLFSFLLFLISAFSKASMALADCDLSTAQGNKVSMAANQKFSSGGLLYDKVNDRLEVSVSGNSSGDPSIGSPTLSVKNAQTGIGCTKQMNNVLFIFYLDNAYAQDETTKRLRALAYDCAQGSNSALRGWSVQGTSGSYKMTINGPVQQGVVTVDLRAPGLSALFCN